MKNSPFLVKVALTCATFALAGTGAIAADTAQPVAAVPQSTYATPEAACAALVAASEQFDLGAMTRILGPDGVKLVTGDDKVQDKNQAAEFAAKAREKTDIARDEKDPHRATVSVG